MKEYIKQGIGIGIGILIVSTAVAALKDIMPKQEKSEDEEA